MTKHIHIHVHRKTRDAGEFREEDHPRRKDGKFGSGGGGATHSAPGTITPEMKAKLAKLQQKPVAKVGTGVGGVRSAHEQHQHQQQQSAKAGQGAMKEFLAKKKAELATESATKSVTAPGGTAAPAKLSKEDHATVKEYANMMAEAQFQNGEEDEADALLDAVDKLEAGRKLSASETKSLVNLIESAAENHDDPTEIKSLERIVAQLKGGGSSKTSTTEPGSKAATAVKSDEYRTAVEAGASYTAVLDRNNRAKISKLGDGETYDFKDEQGKHWIAEKRGDQIQLLGGDTRFGPKSYKLHFPASKLGA